MSEITKLYVNAMVKPIIYCSKPLLDCDARETGNCKQDCEYYSGKKIFTPFTAEKVLEIIVFFLNKGIRLDFSVKENTKISVENFKECIAQIGVKYWQDLTSEEKQQVKGILE